MKTQIIRFNFYLLALAGLAVGCQTGKGKRETSTIRLHLEVNQDATGRSGFVPIYRAEPIWVNVENKPFLDEGSIAQASLVDALGGHQIMLQFDRRGTWLLEQYSTASRGKRVAIFSQFGESRWLAAPVLNERIADGTLVFTPDATREEAERIVRGLNRIARELKKRGA